MGESVIVMWAWDYKFTNSHEPKNGNARRLPIELRCCKTEALMTASFDFAHYQE